MDTSWIVNVTQYLEDAKPYPSSDRGEYLLATYNIFLHENGKEQIVAWAMYNETFGPYLESLLVQVDKQSKVSVTEEFVDEVLATDKVVDLQYRFYGNYTSREDLSNLSGALFVLEDSLNEGLRGKILTSQNVNTNGPPIGLWSSWTITK